MPQPQKCTFWEKKQMTNFYDFALKIETSVAKWVFEPILETTNANDVLVCLVYILILG